MPIDARVPGGAVGDRVAGAAAEMQGVQFAYGSVPVLFGVDLRVEPGEMLGLLGTNGAGKSTLLRILCGLERPSAGRVVVDGCDVTGASVVAMTRRGVTLLPGGRAVFPDLTVWENLQVGAHLLVGRDDLVHERVDVLFEVFPRLRERRRQRAGSLSGGEQQQLALAKAMLLRPRLLCIDELSLGLAPAVVGVLLDVVRAVNSEGATVVLVEQSLNIAASLCDRCLFLEKGEVRFEGAPSDLLKRDDIVRAVFLGKDGAPKSTGL